VVLECFLDVPKRMKIIPLGFCLIEQRVKILKEVKM
jgi:hypothetical protein